MRDIDQAQLEAWASGLPVFGAVDPARTGQARYELRLRDQEYAEQQEKSRRDFETALPKNNFAPQPTWRGRPDRRCGPRAQQRLARSFKPRWLSPATSGEHPA
jgi:hypothetical protein